MLTLSVVEVVGLRLEKNNNKKKTLAIVDVVIVAGRDRCKGEMGV